MGAVTTIDWDLVIPKRVQAGIDWLDEHRPGWVDLIELSGFSIMDGCKCVIGQIARKTDPAGTFGSVFTDHPYETFDRRDDSAIQFLFGLTKPLPLSEAVARGFTLRSTKEPWGKLQREWERRIEGMWAA